MGETKLYLALSCLQGRPVLAAAQELLSLGPYGLQLTPGNVPQSGFREWLQQNRVNYLTHHGFCWKSLKRSVWDRQGALLTSSVSVHPPLVSDMDSETWQGVLENKGNLPVLETMYPGYYLGSGTEIEAAMEMKIDLAVDVSHIFIQKINGAISGRTWEKLQDYERIREIHVSANSGKADTHRRISAVDFGISWAVEKSREIPVVLECYMHNLSGSERQQQLEIILNQS